MTATAMTIAAIITSTWSTRPTAVITESSENTMSINAICSSTATKLTARRPVLVVHHTFERVVDFPRGLGDQEQTPPISRIRSRPEIASPKTTNNGSVSFIIHVDRQQQTIRITIASARPTNRPRAR